MHTYINTKCFRIADIRIHIHTYIAVLLCARRRRNGTWPYGHLSNYFNIRPTHYGHVAAVNIALDDRAVMDAQFIDLDVSKDLASSDFKMYSTSGVEDYVSMYL